MEIHVLDESNYNPPYQEKVNSKTLDTLNRNMNLVDITQHSKDVNVLAIIPARGGSKGIPKKNIKLLSGRPLICHTIENALRSEFITRVVVSTDHDDISDISKKAGVEVIMRPPYLARDDSPMIDAIFHVLENVEGREPDFIILLQPTSPLRGVEDIDGAIQLFLKKQCDSLISVCPVESSPYWQFSIDNGFLTPLFNETFLKIRRQELPIAYRPNGAIYIISPEVLRIHQGFYCKKTVAYVMTIESSIDIDTETDFQIAERLLRQGRL